MGYDAEIHHRRSIRLEGYDYREIGAYFVTVCTQNHVCLFGDVADGEMRLNDAGRMVHAVWDALPLHYPGIGIDAFVVMPNHVHGIVGAAPCGRPDSGQAQGPAPTGCGDLDGRGQARGPAPTDCGDLDGLGQARGPARTGGDRARVLGLADVIHRFKTLTTHRYIQGVKEQDWPAFDRRLWQRNYYEHIIRNDESLNRITDYIMDNPVQWIVDRENPAGTRWHSPRGKNEAWRV